MLCALSIILIIATVSAMVAVPTVVMVRSFRIAGGRICTCPRVEIGLQADMELRRQVCEPFWLA